jgi:hypothetical protein
LKSEYKVQPAIVAAVESEAFQILLTNPRFMGRQEQLKKAIANKTIVLLDQESLTSLVGAALVDEILRQIDAEGRRLHSRLDRGEAYTHAAAASVNSI